jgi:alkylation response protein AidB-like acyl-CoA dehydrogenase
MVSYVLALEEIAAADGGLSTVMSVNNSPDCAALLTYGSVEQKEKWLKPLARGEILGAFCLTEPQAGSDASNLKSRAVHKGNGWVLNGTKQFITSGRIADMALVFAVTDPTSAKRGISCFIVPTKTPGYRVASVERKLGQKSSDTCQIASRIVPSTPTPAWRRRRGLSHRTRKPRGRTHRNWGAGGRHGPRFVEFARAYAGEREAFGTKIINHQAVHLVGRHGHKGGGGAADGAACATLRDAGAPCLTEAAMAAICFRDGEEVCSSRDPDPWRLRLCRRLLWPRRLARCAGVPDLRGHQRRAKTQSAGASRRCDTCLSLVAGPAK